MRIAIDLQAAQSGSRLGGIGRYSIELAKAMVLAAPEDEFFIILNDRMSDSIPEIRHFFRGMLPQSNFKLFSSPPNCHAASKNHATIAAAEILREQFINNLHPDILHISSVVEGMQDPVVCSIGRLSKPYPVAATLYDLIPLVHQEQYLRTDIDRAHYFDRVATLAKSDLLLAISQYSKEEAQIHLHGFRGEIVNIRGGVDPKFTPMGDTHLRPVIVNEYGIRKPFLLYVASFDQRKNHEGLIRAFAALPHTIKNQYQLVITGNGWPGVYAKLHKLGNECGLAPDTVVFTGSVTDNELISLYRSCALFVFPSFWEGMGLPPLEAMACGAPVLASNTTSLSEIIPHPSAGFDPSSIQSISERIEYFLSDPSRLSWLRDKGMNYVREFTWTKTAEVALDSLRKTVEACKRREPPKSVDSDELVLRAVAGCRLSSSEKREMSICVAKNTIAEINALDSARKIGWVTTWDKRCGIASYSQYFVANFPPNTVVFCQKDRTVEFGLPNKVVPSFRDDRNDTLEELYTAILGEKPDEVMIQFNYGLFDFFAFSRFIHRLKEAGVALFVTMHSTAYHGDGDDYKMLYQALKQASGIFVHSRSDFTNLARLGIRDNVRFLSFPTFAFAQHQHEQKKVVQIAASNSMKIASYGFLLPGKGLPELIDAVRLLHQEGMPVSLTMVNANYGDSGGVSNAEAKKCRDMIAQFELQDSVKLIDQFLDDRESVALLSSNDLVVYCYQSTKESSSSAVRMGLATGVPVAVTPLSIFDDIAEAVFTLPGTTAPELARGIKKVLGELEIGSPTAERIAKSAKLLRDSTSYPKVAEYLNLMMAGISLAPATT